MIIDKVKLFLPYLVVVLLCVVILLQASNKYQYENKIQNDISSQLFLLQSHIETVVQEETYSDYCYDHAICAVIKNLLDQFRFLTYSEGLSELENVILVYDRLTSHISQRGFSETYKAQYAKIKIVFDVLELPNGKDITKGQFEENLIQLKGVIDREFESFLEFRNEVFQDDLNVK